MNAAHTPRTPHPSGALHALDATLDRFFRATAPVDRGDSVVVAFSGGPDSTALLLGLARLAAADDADGPFRGLRLVAAHLDHGADPGSEERARAAVGIARELGVEAVVERRPVPERTGPGESPEEAGRRVRYAFLEEVRSQERARWVATAHHRDDQAETVALRLLFGSGLEGLGAMRPVRGSLIRPLLALDRATLAAATEEAGLPTLDDPTNRDLSLARNRVRHLLLPRLADDDDRIAERLVGLARATAALREHLEGRFAHLLAPEPSSSGVSRAPTLAGRGSRGEGPPVENGSPRGVGVPRAALAGLPRPLLPHALAYLHRRAGAPYPATAAAAAELVRQLEAGLDTSPDPGGDRARIGCDCGGGWRWEERDDRIELRPPTEGPEAALPRDFSYTLTVPGTLDIPELGVSLRVRREPVAPWMFRGSRKRAALALPVEPGARLVVRRRRPGDRMQPLGAPGTRKLKDLLIDRRIPRERRDRLPLLCLGDRIAWVPGVTVDEAFRVLPGAEQTWVAEVMP